MPVLIILAVLWAVVLLPPILRSRSQHHSADSIVDFNYKLDILRRTNGTRRSLRRHASVPVAPGVRGDAAMRSAKRRRDVMRTLGIAVLATLLVALLAGSGLAWGLQIFVDVLAAAYLALWAWARNLQADHAEKVRYMPELRTPELALRRSASS